LDFQEQIDGSARQVAYIGGPPVRQVRVEMTAAVGLRPQ
jgi:hypothetical protein